MEIHQFHPSFAFGDAIGNEMIEIQKTLKKLGHNSIIFFQHTTLKTPSSKKYKKYKKFSSPDNILIIHYSIAYDIEVLNFIKSLPDKKLLIYHNITPPEYFTNINSQYMVQTKIGREQLRHLSKFVDYAVGDSEYNRQELLEFGFNKTDVLPILMDFKKYEASTDIELEKDGTSTNILFVGRIAPNKKQEDIIKIFYYYKQYIEPESKLYLVGSYEGMEIYYKYLLDLVQRLGLDDVNFTGKINFNDLIAYYKLADFFLCMSEHEGFCVPLLESMYFGIPIIAYNSTAVPYTMGNSGILVNIKNYNEIAEMINFLVKYREIREKIIKKQEQRLKDFTNKKIIKIFKEFIDQIK